MLSSSKLFVRLIFVAVACACAVQYGIISEYGEPYPALMMPEFRGPGGFRDGQIREKRFEAIFVASDGELISISTRELLSDYPVSHHGVIINGFLSPPPHGETLTPAPSVQSGRIYRFFPGLHAGRDRFSRDNVSSLHAWVQKRAYELLPGKPLDRVEFRWYADTFKIKSGKIEYLREPAGLLKVALNGKST